MYRQFADGSRVRHVWSGRVGTVERLRDDAYERDRRASKACHFFYSVEFDDKTFDTYVAESALVPEHPACVCRSHTPPEAVM
jgi:hypothetical protein